MKLKTTLYLMMGMAAMAMASCSNIDEADRLIYVKPAAVGRAVLIEDFTGQKCINCPNATAEIEALQKQYGADSVIAVGIHSGPLGFHTTAKYVGLSTETGDEYYTAWKLDHQPVGLVDRNGGALDADSWSAKVYQEIQKKAALSLAVVNEYDAADNSAKINVSAAGIEGTTTGKLQVWLTEDSITAFQFMPDGSRNYEYVHNHVFRTAVNGTWGEDFSVAEGETKSVSYTAAIDKAWKPEHLWAVAFVYNGDGVAQVTRKKIK